MAETMQLLEGVDPTNSVGRRAVAFILDYLLIGLATAMAFFFADVTIVEQAAVAPGAGVYTYEGPAWQIALVVLMPLIYIGGAFVVLQGLKGYTPGKLVLSLRCVKWDGRAPGILKALVRTITLVGGTMLLGWLWWGTCFLFIVFTKGHRRLGDLVASTYVIDSAFEGRIITITSHGASSGPPSVYAHEVGLAKADDRVAEQAAQRPMEPVYDKRLDTYVVWDAKSKSLMAFDKASGGWNPVSS